MLWTSFRRVFAADVVSTFGSLMSRLAIPWLAVADVAAGALTAPLLGALIDRWPTLRTIGYVHTVGAFGMSFASATYMIYVTRDLGFATGTSGLIAAAALLAAWRCRAAARTR